MAEKQVIYDKFCWRCCGEGTSLECSGCVRTFHTNCSQQNDATTNGDKSKSWLCSVCMSLKEAEKTSNKRELDMLPILIDKALKDKSFNQLKHPLAAGSYSTAYVTESIVNPVNLLKIKGNICNYTSFDHFLSDVQWIVHNCFILFLDNHQRMELAKSLVDYLEEEIEILKKCPECYSNMNEHPNSWFTTICSDPHLIVWAKINFNYWPAKMMTIDGQLINVRFFGDHKLANVPATNCYLYSDFNPNRSRNTTVVYKSALKEADLYMKNCRSKFGAYNTDINTKSTFNPALLDKYIVQVIPALAESKMVKEIQAKRMSMEGTVKSSAKRKSSDLKSTTKPNDEVCANRSPVRFKLNLTALSPKKNVLYSSCTLNEKTSNNKRSGKEAMLSKQNPPCEKKAKVNGEAPNKQNSLENGSKPTQPVTTNQPKSVVTQAQSETKSPKSAAAAADNKSKSQIQSSVQSNGTNGHDVNGSNKSLLNSTEIKWSENSNSNSDFGDVSCINGQTSSEDTDWEQSFEKDLNDTIQTATVHMHSLIEKKLKSKFELLKQKLHAVTTERDQIALNAEQTKQKLKDNHAKEITDLNEKYTQVVAKVKKDAELRLTAEIEKEKVKGENILKETQRVMTEKLKDAEKKLESCEKDRQAMVESKKQYQIETDAAIKKLEKEHNEEITKINAKLQNAITEKTTMANELAAKYRDIVAGIKLKADTERKERISCACCGKQLEAKRVCSTECEEMWGVWKK